MNKKLLTFVIIFIVILLAVPVMAEAAQRDDTGTASDIRGGSNGYDTQSPVLNGGAYSNYDTVFFPGPMANAEVTNAGIYSEIQRPWGLETVIKPVSGGYIDCPIPCYDKRTGGVQPVIKYLAFTYFTEPNLYIDYIEIWNNGYRTNKRSIDFNPDLSYSGAEYKVQIISLGDYYTYNRGLTLALHVKNADLNNNRKVIIGGYGTRFEW
jgi:hypothetical protein